MIHRASLAFALCAAGCGARAAQGPAAPRPPETVSSNIARGDYAGSKACASCHPAVTAAWEKSPMRSMTRLAEDVPVEPVFDGRTFEYKDDRVTLFTQAGARTMRVWRGAEDTGGFYYRVTKIIGGRYREDFVGRRLTRPDPAAPLSELDERVLPVSYLLATGTLRYKGYSVMVPERPYLGKGAVWRKTCIFCHNTLPYLSAVYDDLLESSGGGAESSHGSRGATKRSNTYFGTVSDRLLPENRQIDFHVTSKDGLRDALAAEIQSLGGELPSGSDVTHALGAAVRATRKRFDQSHLVEVGIGCEACHGGSREHVADPAKRPTFEPVSPYLSVTDSGGKKLGRAQQVNRVCARCHTVLFSGYKPTWEGGERPTGAGDAPDSEEDTESVAAAISLGPGGATINSGEARDFLLGGCSSAMACTDCHDPHAKDGFGEKKAAIAHVCQKCHSQYSTPAQIAAHTHHRADGAGSECLDCHMPKKNMGLDYRLTRYHRIGSPTDPARVLHDRPLECALCHEDKSVGELVDAMSAWWGKSYDKAALAALYGPDLREGSLMAALSRGKPHEQAVAAAVLGQRKRKDRAMLLVPVLSNEIPLVRYFARNALETMLGASFPWDVGAGDPDRPAQAQRWIGAR